MTVGTKSQILATFVTPHWQCSSRSPSFDYRWKPILVKAARKQSAISALHSFKSCGGKWRELSPRLLCNPHRQRQHNQAWIALRCRPDQDKSGEALGSVLNVPVLMRNIQGSTPNNLLISDFSSSIIVLKINLKFMKLPKKMKKEKIISLSTHRYLNPVPFVGLLLQFQIHRVRLFYLHKFTGRPRYMWQANVLG